MPVGNVGGHVQTVGRRVVLEFQRNIGVRKGDPGATPHIGVVAEQSSK